MDIRTQIEGPVARVVLGGRFDFSSHRSFRDITEQVMTRPEVKEVLIDLGAVSYLDSSALGMLLMLRDKARGSSAQVKLANCGPSVRQILDVANFQQLFSIV